MHKTRTILWTLRNSTTHMTRSWTETRSITMRAKTVSAKRLWETKSVTMAVEESVAAADKKILSPCTIGMGRITATDQEGDDGHVYCILQLGALTWDKSPWNITRENNLHCTGHPSTPNWQSGRVNHGWKVYFRQVNKGNNKNAPCQWKNRRNGCQDRG